MSGRYTSKNPIVDKDLKSKGCVSWFNSEPEERPGRGLKPLKYNCEKPKKRSTSPTDKKTKKLRVSPIVVPKEMKTKNNKTKKGGRLPPEIPSSPTPTQRRTPAHVTNFQTRLEIINDILNDANNDRNIRLQGILHQVAPGEFGMGMVVLNAQYYLNLSGDFRLLRMIYDAYNIPQDGRMELPDENGNFTGGKSLKKIKTKSNKTKKGGRKLRKSKTKKNKKSKKKYM